MFYFNFYTFKIVFKSHYHPLVNWELGCCGAYRKMKMKNHEHSIAVAFHSKVQKQMDSQMSSLGLWTICSKL